MVKENVGGCDPTNQSKTCAVAWILEPDTGKDEWLC